FLIIEAFIRDSSLVRAGGKAGELPGQPAALVLQLAEGGFHGGELRPQGGLAGGEADVPVGDLVVELLALCLTPADGGGDRAGAEVDGVGGGGVEAGGNAGGVGEGSQGAGSGGGDRQRQAAEGRVEGRGDQGLALAGSGDTVDRAG